MSIAEQEKAKYTKVWDNPLYREGCHSIGVWEDYCSSYGPDSSVIDLGCGTGRLVDRLNQAGHYAYGVDIAPNSVDPDILKSWNNRFSFQPLWEKIPLVSHQLWDVGVCTDVMEHIPEELVKDTLQCIMRACHQVFFLIAGTLDYAGRMGEVPLHLTVKSHAWWLERFLKMGWGVDMLSPGKYHRASSYYFRVWQ
ncbi:hypothetical protein LCGC14_3007360 [marine sediment metagenome]|uniref:Methyltransferase domain-containing protein n=1 Tax=marine sediment metagenome TaxID=412755 RepID=A0A0F8XLZ8_9ZZZZ